MVLHCKKYKLKNQNVFQYLSGYIQTRNTHTRIKWRRRQLIPASQIQDRLISTLEIFVHS
jgi:hypothetical protein